MKEILNVLVLSGFIYILFVFLRGMNKTQVAKHEKKLAEIEKKNAEKDIKEENT